MNEDERNEGRDEGKGANKTVPPAKPSAEPPAADDQRTIFMPGETGFGPAGDQSGGHSDNVSGAAAGEPSVPESQGSGWDPPADPERTKWQPGTAPPVSVGTPGEWQSSPPPPRQTTAMGGSLTEPRAPTGGIQIGDVLNHIFEVTRFIARGGMGEVFEGCNINSDERVAIKVMLPTLAQDANIISMFRKEARTLTKLQHEALVQYRVLAQEPQLGVLYIVTEFIDGTNLSDVLGTMKASPADLTMLLRRLAGGLRAAHALGAIHRDMSPDNVLLEEGRLSGAKVIDFGIAKDLDPGAATIVGDGFAGKLNYVAPEQLGDFGREVGPWTDVYSLGLVILATAMGRDVQMGGTLVDAVDKRRAGPDLSPAPETLRPVLARMLTPDPAARLRSMDEVLAALDGAPGAGPAAAAPVAAQGGLPKRTLVIAGGAATAAVAVAAAFLLMPSSKSGPAQHQRQASSRPAVSAGTTSGDPIGVARAAINGALPGVECSWLDVTQLTAPNGRPLVRLTGVAGNPAAAQSQISSAMSSAGLSTVDIDFSEVAQIKPAGCSALDTYRQIRVTDGSRLSVPKRTFRMEKQQNGDRASKAVINVGISDPTLDFSLWGIEPSGALSKIVVSKTEMLDIIRTAVKGDPASDLGDQRYRMLPEIDHLGWSGVLLLTGQGPFDQATVAPGPSQRGPDWRKRFTDAAARQHWKAEMIWFKSVDEVPG